MEAKAASYLVAAQDNSACHGNPWGCGFPRASGRQGWAARAGGRSRGFGGSSAAGFTLVELLVVIAILGLLVGLMFPAVQAARDAARRTQCADNLHNLGLTLHQFHDVHGALPLGRATQHGLDHAWSSAILPYLEETALATRLDWDRPWNDPRGNAQVAITDIPSYRCPSSTNHVGGQIDYGGIIGSSLTGLRWGYGSSEAFGSGTLIQQTPKQPRPVKFASIVDGLAHTLVVGEASDRGDRSSGKWACGRNCFSVEDAISHETSAYGFFSLHLGGAHGLLADGSVHFLSDSMEKRLLGAMATRNGNDRALVTSASF
jgi:prepilin-type N-terminal cleavage/methylation domain-containing protein